MQPIIEVKNLAKQYRLGTTGTGSLHHDINRWWHTVRGKEDPYLTIGETNDRSTKGESDYVWALRDINFSVMPGEVLGIIGRNGAGKSTLLKILSRITTPTTGSVRLRGRVASLLEVGTGMHPELTGRENIYLNGAILGMRKKEIDRKLDEIVDFSGVERYLDTPVKRYSSGMHVRLGFAVAAYLEPDILIVDEVLAVGDAEFQKKCLGKMQNVSENEGRTILFVSHDMRSIAKICKTAIELRDGRIFSTGKTEQIVNSYLQSSSLLNKEQQISGTLDIELKEIIINQREKLSASRIFFGEEVQIELILEGKRDIKNLGIAICFDDLNGNRITSCWSEYKGEFQNIEKGINRVVFTIPKIHLIPQLYSLVIYINKDSNTILRIDNAKIIEVEYPYFTFNYATPQKSQGTYLEDFFIKA